MILYSPLPAFQDTTRFRPIRVCHVHAGLHELPNEVTDAAFQVGKKVAKNSTLHSCTNRWVTPGWTHFQKALDSDRPLYL